MKFDNDRPTGREEEGKKERCEDKTEDMRHRLDHKGKVGLDTMPHRVQAVIDADCWYTKRHIRSYN